jgi:alkanesulfonate monooxygenase SsuD/methylene tetrahydromethanopterin reductase-like flavin-dependent oxidoreductase (luciferase family)
MAGPTFGKNPPATELNFGIVAGQHYRSWRELVEQFQWAEETGWDSAWVFDHFLSLRDGHEIGDCMDGWTLLGGLAAMTSRIQIGLMVTGITYRHPSVLFKQVVTVDQISGGRCIFGVGAAWNDREHDAYGIPFPPPRERVDMFGEAMEMYRLLETQERSKFEGQHFRLVDAPFEPKPVFGHVPILVGSSGCRMMRHIARYADLWDGGGTPEEYAADRDRLHAICCEIGRNPNDIRMTLQSGIDAIRSVDTFTKHVRNYAAIGVRTFLMVIPIGYPNAILEDIAKFAIPEIRERYRADALI